jgi:hypothetical protein
VSDATEGLLDQFRREFGAVSELPGAEHVQVDTTLPLPAPVPMVEHAVMMTSGAPKKIP